MTLLESALDQLAHSQKKHVKTWLLAILLVTAVLSFGITKLRLESNLANEMPQDLPIFQLNDRLADEFGGQDTVLLVVELDDQDNALNSIKDIRDPRILTFLSNLQTELQKESLVDETFSAATIAQPFPGQTIQDVIALGKIVPDLDAFYNPAYTKTIVFIRADVGGGEDKVLALENLIQQRVNDVERPPGISLFVTGNPSIQKLIFSFLTSDAAYTLSLTVTAIFLLLLILERSITKSMLVMVPTLLGVFWAMGLMGWFDIPLSIATVGLGAILVGLGVEYGVFMVTRYKEQRELGKSQSESLYIAVPGVGTAIMGSGLTTVAGFGALSFSFFPMMQHLGQSLALGILCSLSAALFAAPVVILLEEELEYRWTHSQWAKLEKKAQQLALKGFERP
ncbi:MMPL family transporter [Candidatus Micrarchaeota archaeon]|nr:MMPL family transporter [Candidatus Micrarchaeota archaeon]